MKYLVHLDNRMYPILNPLSYNVVFDNNALLFLLNITCYSRLFKRIFYLVNEFIKNIHSLTHPFFIYKKKRFFSECPLKYFITF